MILKIGGSVICQEKWAKQKKPLDKITSMLALVFLLP